MSTVMPFVVVVAFTWNLDVPYTSAMMGMPFAAPSIAEGPASCWRSRLNG
jgi:hypothetical protein